MNIYTQDSPGDWQDWVKLPRNKNIPILEAKQKFLNEQLLHENQYQSFVQQQVAIQTQNAQTGGTGLNGVKTVNFDATPSFQTITGNVQTITATFAKPVTVVSGVPLITVTNNQLGGGSNATFDYTYTAGSGGRELTFSHTHPSYPNNNGGFAGNVVETGGQLVFYGGVIVDPAGSTDGIYAFAGNTNYTTSGNGVNIGLQVTINGGFIESVEVTSDGNEFVPDEIITFADASLGAGSTGGSISVKRPAFLADTVSFAEGSSISLNGAILQTGDGSFNTQYNDINRRQSTPALSFVSTSTKTGVVS